jgi:CysZ protein
LEQKSVLLNMSFLSSMYLGIRMYASAWRFIVLHKLYWFAFIPGGLMVLIFFLGHKLQLHTPDFEPKNVNELVWFCIQLSAEIFIARFLMGFAKYLVVILLSPMLSHISQKTEKIVSNNSYPFKFSQLWKDVKRGMRIAFRNITWEIFLFGLIFCVSLMGWGTIQDSPIHFLIYLVSFYYYGFSFLDYINERLKLSFEQSVRLVRMNRGLAMVLGAVYSLLLWNFIDLSFLYQWKGDQLGVFDGMYNIIKTLILWIMASFAPVWTIVAATLAMHELYDLKKAKTTLESSLIEK